MPRIHLECTPGREATVSAGTRGWARQDSNLGPRDYESPALTAELQARIAVTEVPAKSQWCEIRTTVFSWTLTRFPFHTSSAKKLTLNHTPVITVTGKAFFDVGHSLKDQRSNRRSHLPGYAAWELRPVMALQIVQ